MSALMKLSDVAMRFPLASGAGEQQHVVFEGLDFSLSAGECVGLVGANGVGKSTLLRVMAKILAPSAGKVEWATGVSASLLSLGLGFRPDLTGEENALLANLLQGMSKRDAQQAPDMTRLAIIFIEAAVLIAFALLSYRRLHYWVAKKALVS